MTWREEVIGNCRMILGDCRDILPTLESPVDAVVTDPPYAVSKKGSKNVSPKGTRNFDFFEGDCDWDKMNKDVRQALLITLRFRPTSFVCWCSHRQVGFINDMLETNQYRTGMLFWRKKCPAPAPPGSGWISAVECAVTGRLSGAHWGGGTYDANIFDADNYRYGQPGKLDHPTQKPISLMSWHMRLMIKCGDTVLDPFMGSGTTAISCVDLNMKFIGIEKNEKYFDMACRRIDGHIGVGSLLNPCSSLPIRRKGYARAKPTGDLLL